MGKQTWLIFVIIVLLAGWLTPPGATAQAGGEKVAVLISTGNTTTDDQWYHSEYWYDLMLTYRMLIENGFTHDHIYVLYGNGTDFASAHADYQNPYPNAITDFAVTRANIQNIFQWLAAGDPAHGITALTNNDFLFVWWMGHGGGDASCNTGFSVSTTGETVSDTDLATWTNAITYRRRAFVFMTCHSGGAMDNLQSVATLTTPSCTCTENSASANYDVVHGEWTYWVDVALRQLLATGPAVNSDTDANGRVSFQETFNWASAQTMASTPQLSDLGGIAPCVFLRLPVPGADVEIYSRDHVHDNGTVPSSYETWYDGPDLWVRHAQDGGTIHEDPEYGQTNYVYANVFNIGCAAASNITVDFSWVQPSGWSNPALWTSIDTANIASLPALNTTTVNVPWPTVPLPGAYCLHTRLNAIGDTANTDGRAYMDNNKVQINVTVQDTWAGASSGWYFFIENGSEEFMPIDLVFDSKGVPQGATLRVQLPRGLKFEGVSGADVIQTEDGRTVLAVPAGLKVPARVVGVQLQSGERQRAIMTITLPRDMGKGEEATVLFEERVKDETMGGIRFVSRASAPESVTCDLLRKKINVFNSLAKLTGQEEGVKIAEISKELVTSGKCADKEAFSGAMTGIAPMEAVVGEKLTSMSPEYAPLYLAAIARLTKAVEGDEPLFVVEAQQEVLLYASIILSDELAR